MITTNGIYLLEEYINSSRKLVEGKDNIFQKIRNFFPMGKSSSTILNENMDLILDSIDDYSQFVDFFFDNEEFEKSPENIVKIYDKIKKEYSDILINNEEILNDNSEMNIENMERCNIREGLKKRLSKLEYTMDDIAVKYFDKIKDTDSEKDSINKLFEMTSGDNLRIPLIFSIIEQARGKSPELDEKINGILQENKTAFSEYLIGKKIKIQPFQKLPKDKEKYNVFLTRIIDELLEEQKKDFIDIKQIGTGSTSDVYKIGDKILKIGSKRITEKIPYSRRILQPLYRSNLDDDDKLFIEISERVQGIGFEETAYEDEVYKIFKELMDEGIVWMDPAPRNIGILLKDNEAFLDGEAIDVDSNASNIIPKGKKDVLKKDDFIILDTDYIYSLDDLPQESRDKSRWTASAQYYMNKYEEEKRNETNQKEEYERNGMLADCMQDTKTQFSQEQEATQVVIAEVRSQKEEKSKEEEKQVSEGEAYGE